MKLELYQQITAINAALGVVGICAYAHTPGRSGFYEFRWTLELSSKRTPLTSTILNLYIWGDEEGASPIAQSASLVVRHLDEDGDVISRNSTGGFLADFDTAPAACLAVVEAIKRGDEHHGTVMNRFHKACFIGGN